MPTTQISNLKSAICLLAAVLLALLATPVAQAATLYWDGNDSAAGFGTAGGTWAAPPPAPPHQAGAQMRPGQRWSMPTA